MSIAKPTIFAALIAGVLAIGGLAGGASAAPLSTANMTAGAEKAGVEQVGWRDHRGHRYYRGDRRHWRPHHSPRYSRWHGPRYRYRRPGFAHFYSGYWYPSPWWLRGPGPVIVFRP